MIIPDHITALALLAMDDPDALQVLEDAMLEDGRDWLFAYEIHTTDGWGRCASWLYPVGALSLLHELTPRPRVIAAIGLFQCWPTSWPLAARCRVYAPFRVVGMSDFLAEHMDRDDE